MAAPPELALERDQRELYPAPAMELIQEPALKQELNLYRDREMFDSTSPAYLGMLDQISNL